MTSDKLPAVMSLPFKGEDKRGEAQRFSPIPTPTLPLKGREIS
jgi:hypothetical protein